MISLYKDKKDCTGCGACLNKCPVQAITMKEDEYGFSFPEINESCIECGLCKKVCQIHNKNISEKFCTLIFAAVNKDKEMLLNSSSGGVFGALAKIILKRKGIVFGCAYNSKMEAEHIYIENITELNRLQGSKYVQSKINTNYLKVKEFLNLGKWVLFSGTPCQISGLKLFLNKEYQRLITVDLVCHGVPSPKFFSDYLVFVENKLKGKIEDVDFRNKKEGWNLTGEVTYKNRNKIYKKKLETISSYYNYFLSGDIYRESCYSCKYACKTREGDFTIGDYWGIEKFHSSIKKENGVSSLMINTSKGETLLEELKIYLNLTGSSFENISEQNEQLKNPSSFSLNREKIFELWKKGSYELIENNYKKCNRMKIILFHIKRLMPEKTKKLIKRFINL